MPSKQGGSTRRTSFHFMRHIGNTSSIALEKHSLEHDGQPAPEVGCERLGIDRVVQTSA